MGDPRLVRLLLDHGAKVSSRDTYQNTALILAVYEQTVDLEENLPCIGLLLDAGADPLDTPDGTIRANCLTFAKDRGMKRTQMLLEHCLRERAYLGLLQGN
jgi:ankyrin repeat protein